MQNLRIWDGELEKFIFKGSIQDLVAQLQWAAESNELTRLDPKRAVFQYSTGLIDLNGKEVFEGDILNIDDCEYYATVDYCEEFARFNFNVYLIGGEEYSMDDLSFTAEYRNEDEIKVVGNILEDKGFTI